MPFLNAGETVFSKYLSDIQMVIDVGGAKQYVPLTSFSYNWATENTKEHYSGQRPPANLTQGNTDITVTFETGWVTDHPEDAEYWEFLLSKLVNFADGGTTRPFDIELHEREYVGEAVKGGKVWASFRECKLTKHSGSGSQGSQVKRTYEADVLRGAWGIYGEEAGA